jgi:hypothetical protein
MKMILTLALLAASLANGFSAAGVIPEKIRACPPWVVTVIDSNGLPIPGVAVVQEWGCNFDGSIVMATTNAVTDSAGQVRFEARYLEVPPAMGPVKEFFVRLNSPGGPVPWNTVTASKAGYETTRFSVLRNPKVTWTRDGLRATVVLPRWKPGT